MYRSVAFLLLFSLISFSNNNPQFDEFKKISFDEFKNQNNFQELSMGMSSDYLEAIENNATFVRIGSSIFGQRS